MLDIKKTFSRGKTNNLEVVVFLGEGLRRGLLQRVISRGNPKHRTKFLTLASSFVYCSIRDWSTETSGGASAGAATKSRAGLLCGDTMSQRGIKSYQINIPYKLASKPQERLLEVVVGLRRNLKVLEILLAVEGDRASLDFSLLHTSQLSEKLLARLIKLTHLNVHLVTAQHKGDIFTYALKIAMPVGDILVGDAGGNVKHDDAALALDVVSIAQSTELLLPSRVPHVEADSAEVGRERQRVDLDTERSCKIVATYQNY